MAETKKTRSKRFPKVADVTARVVEAPRAAAAEAVESTEQALDQGVSSGNALRLAMEQSAALAGQGILDLNSRIFEAIRLQSDVALETWRSTIHAPSISEAVNIQASGVRQAYETATGQWREIAQATTQLMGKSVEPIRSVWTDK